MYIARLSGYAIVHAFPFIEPGLPPRVAGRYRVFIYLGLSNRTCRDYVLHFGLASFSTIRHSCFVVRYGRRPHRFPLFILHDLETCHDIIRQVSLDSYDHYKLQLTLWTSRPFRLTNQKYRAASMPPIGDFRVLYPRVQWNASSLINSTSEFIINVCYHRETNTRRRRLRREGRTKTSNFHLGTHQTDSCILGSFPSWLDIEKEVVPFLEVGGGGSRSGSRRCCNDALAVVRVALAERSSRQ